MGNIVKTAQQTSAAGQSYSGDVATASNSYGGIGNKISVTDGGAFDLLRDTLPGVFETVIRGVELGQEGANKTLAAGVEAAQAPFQAAMSAATGETGRIMDMVKIGMVVALGVAAIQLVKK